jgi:hypothetical protein
MECFAFGQKLPATPTYEQIGAEHQYCHYHQRKYCHTQKITLLLYILHLINPTSCQTNVNNM